MFNLYPLIGIIAETMLDDSWVIVGSIETEAETPSKELETCDGDKDMLEWTGQEWCKYV